VRCTCNDRITKTIVIFTDQPAVITSVITAQTVVRKDYFIDESFLKNNCEIKHIQRGFKF